MIISNPLASYPAEQQWRGGHGFFYLKILRNDTEFEMYFKKVLFYRATFFFLIFTQKRCTNLVPSNKRAKNILFHFYERTLLRIKEQKQL